MHTNRQRLLLKQEQHTKQQQLNAMFQQLGSLQQQISMLPSGTTKEVIATRWELQAEIDRVLSQIQTAQFDMMSPSERRNTKDCNICSELKIHGIMENVQLEKGHTTKQHQVYRRKQVRVLSEEPRQNRHVRLCCQHKQLPRLQSIQLVKHKRKSHQHKKKIKMLIGHECEEASNVLKNIPSYFDRQNQICRFCNNFRDPSELPYATFRDRSDARSVADNRQEGICLTNVASQGVHSLLQHSSMLESFDGSLDAIGNSSNFSQSLQSKVHDSFSIDYKVHDKQLQQIAQQQDVTFDESDCDLYQLRQYQLGLCKQTTELTIAQSQPQNQVVTKQIKQMEFTRHRELLQTHILSQSVNQSLIMPSALSRSSKAPSRVPSSQGSQAYKPMNIDLKLPVMTHTIKLPQNSNAKPSRLKSANKESKPFRLNQDSSSEHRAKLEPPKLPPRLNFAAASRLTTIAVQARSNTTATGVKPAVLKHFHSRHWSAKPNQLNQKQVQSTGAYLKFVQRSSSMCRTTPQKQSTRPHTGLSPHVMFI